MDRRRKIRDKEKQYIWGYAILAIGVAGLLGLYLYREQLDNDLESEIQASTELNVQVSTEEKEYTEYIRMTFHFEEDDTAESNFPEELIEYMYCSVEEKRLIPALIDIETEYELLNEQEIKAVTEKEDSDFNSLSSFQYYEGNEEDRWFRVSLAEKDDIVIVHTDKKADYTYILFFENLNGEGKWYEQALCAENYQKGSYPYFIEWEGKKYIAVPYWGMGNEKDEIRGVTISDYSDLGVIVGIGVNNDNTRNICYQAYDIGSVRGEWAEIFGKYQGRWPRVVKEQYEWEINGLE